MNHKLCVCLPVSGVLNKTKSAETDTDAQVAIDPGPLEQDPCVNV